MNEIHKESQNLNFFSCGFLSCLKNHSQSEKSQQIHQQQLLKSAKSDKKKSHKKQRRVKEKEENNISSIHNITSNKQQKSNEELKINDDNNMMGDQKDIFDKINIEHIKTDKYSPKQYNSIQNYVMGSLHDLTMGTGFLQLNKKVLSQQILKNGTTNNTDKETLGMNFAIIDPDLVDKAAKITLKVVDGEQFYPQILEINGLGLQNVESRRNKHDGIVYFGSKIYQKETSQQPWIDYLIQQEEERAIGGRHFAIQYDTNSNRYLLKDMGMGTGTFLKIARNHFIQNGNLFSIGKDLSFLAFIERQTNEDVNEQMFNENQEYVQQVEEESKSLIQINFIESFSLKSGSFQTSNTVKTYSFSSHEVPILIGRTKECKIRFKEGALSRIQCRIDYINENWILKDGNGKDKISTNGTWLFVQNPIQIEDNDLIKAGNAILQVNYTQL